MLRLLHGVLLRRVVLVVAETNDLTLDNGRLVGDAEVLLPGPAGGDATAALRQRSALSVLRWRATLLDALGSSTRKSAWSFLNRVLLVKIRSLFAQFYLFKM